MWQNQWFDPDFGEVRDELDNIPLTTFNIIPPNFAILLDNDKYLSDSASDKSELLTPEQHAAIDQYKSKDNLFRVLFLGNS